MLLIRSGAIMVTASMFFESIGVASHHTELIILALVLCLLGFFVSVGGILLQYSKMQL